METTISYTLFSPTNKEILKKAHRILKQAGVLEDKNWNIVYNPDTPYPCPSQPKLSDSVIVDGDIYKRTIWHYALTIPMLKNGLMSFSCVIKEHAYNVSIYITEDNFIESIILVVKNYFTLNKDESDKECISDNERHFGLQNRIEEYRKVKAVFKGQDGSCGFTKNKEYQLFVGKRANGNIKVNDKTGRLYCEYSSLIKLLENWDCIRNERLL